MLLETYTGYNFKPLNFKPLNFKPLSYNWTKLYSEFLSEHLVHPNTLCNEVWQTQYTDR